MLLSSASLIRPTAHAQSISCLYVHLFLGTFFLILDLRRWSLASRPANTEAASAELHGELNVGPPCQWPLAVAEQQEAALTAVGFEPTPLRNGALSHRLRPLGQTVLRESSTTTRNLQVKNPATTFGVLETDLQTHPSRQFGRAV